MSTIQVGNVSFREIRENDYCYVDKTAFVAGPTHKGGKRFN